MQKDLDITILNDIYGSLLTEKQQEVINEYYYMDNSLAEIAENKGISRQSVRDSIQLAIKSLKHFDDNLHLKDKFLQINNLVDDKIQNKATETELKESMQKILSILEE